MFALVDCNSFYCSCEAVFQLRLWGKPVVVLSNNDGCVIARSPEAKAAGIPMGAPAFKYRDEFAMKHVEVFSSNYELYGDMSARVMQVLAKEAAAIEIYSIDEAFLNLESTPADLQRQAEHIRQTVRQWTGIPVGIGVAATKVLAKLANRYAKKHGGVFVLDHDSAEGQTIIEDWPVEDLWGVAGRLAGRLNCLSIFTAGQLARAKTALIRQRFGVVLERIVLELRGVSCLALAEIEPARQNICCSRSFGTAVENCESLQEAVATHATRAGEKLRAQGLAASAIHVFLLTNRHRPEQPQYNPSAGRALLVPTSFTMELIGEAMRIVRAIYKPGFAYKKAGLICLGLVPDDEKQASLFRPVDPVQEEKERRLMEAVDKLNLWGGRGTVRAASLSTGRKQDWQMRRDQLSPCYTTRVEEVPRVKLQY